MADRTYHAESRHTQSHCESTGAVGTFHNCVQNHVERNSHVFVAVHGSSEVEIWRFWLRGRLCAHGVEGIINFVASAGSADAREIGFFGTIRRYDAEIGGFAASGNVAYVDEMDGVGSLDGTGALGVMTNFISVQSLPESAFPNSATLSVSGLSALPWRAKWCGMAG